MNSKSVSFGSLKTDTNGKVLEDVLTTYDTVLLNDEVHTYDKFNSSYTEKLDLFLSSHFLSRLLSNFQVLTDYDLGSDHYPVICNFNFNHKNFNSIPTKQNDFHFNFFKADWILFQRILNNSNINLNEIESLNEQILSEILNAAKITIPAFSKNRNSDRMLPQKILELINKRRDIRKQIRTTKNPLLKTEYNKLTKTIKIEILN